MDSGPARGRRTVTGGQCVAPRADLSSPSTAPLPPVRMWGGSHGTTTRRCRRPALTVRLARSKRRRGNRCVLEGGRRGSWAPFHPAGVASERWGLHPLYCHRQPSPKAAKPELARIETSRTPAVDPQWLPESAVENSTNPDRRKIGVATVGRGRAKGSSLVAGPLRRLDQQTLRRCEKRARRSEPRRAPRPARRPPAHGDPPRLTPNGGSVPRGQKVTITGNQPFAGA